MNEDQIRRDFEDFVEAKGWSVDRLETNPSRYQDSHTEIAWITWQAAANKYGREGSK